MHVADRPQGCTGTARGKVPRAARVACIARSACSSLTMSWWVGGSLRTCSFLFFWSRCCCCCCVLLLLPTTSVLKRREVPATVSSFSVSATTTAVSFASILFPLLLLRKDIHFHFLVEVLLLLIIFLVGCAAAAGGACAAYNISTEAERGTGYCFFLLRFRPLQCDASDVYCCCCFWLILFLSFRLRCFRYGC